MCKKERLKKGLLKIGEIAKEAGVLCSSIRYYTDVGLLQVAERLLPEAIQFQSTFAGGRDAVPYAKKPELEQRHNNQGEKFILKMIGLGE